MESLRANRRVLIGSILVALLGITGCMSTKPGANVEDDSLKRTIDRAIDDIRRSYESEDPTDIIRRVHSDYSGSVRSRGELRSQMRDVFSDYQRINLEFHGTRVTKEESTVHAKVNWNLNWTCQRTINRDIDDDGNPECPSRNLVVTRRGRTTFSFQKNDDGEWKLIQQRDNQLLGSRAPGREQDRS